MEECKRFPKGDTEIGYRIKYYREKKFLTQKELAERVMVSASSITRLESGQTMVSVFTIIKIAEALEIPIEYIFSDLEKDESGQRELAGLSAKLNKCTMTQRKAIIRSFEEMIDAFFLK